MTPADTDTRTAPIPVLDLHCDTADRIAWQSLPAELRAAYGHDFYGPGDEADPAGCRDLAHSHCHISLEKIGPRLGRSASRALSPTSSRPSRQ